MKKIILYFLFFVLFVFALRLVLSQKSKQAIQNTRPEHTLEARQLFAEFYRDEAGANEKYLNKIIAVSGEVAEAKKDSKGNFAILLVGGGADFFLAGCCRASSGLLCRGGGAEW